ncbi:hypothetical protein QO002_001166 [Pararhizobium capsulatum DSM 1112]|uniref:Regulator of ribonuclease activity B domain-containing protein n=1 Tax=Pararhizobium capsulatum DSM 1112 TaxID=1121113 RepID=A0ABU0BM72_9HYPH|nr:ribonuclease E inhibitor RraB [Pararhizobium capsulatum]MDQ0319028.1 hypothetical protein [Pararhizobium capsulatum DSM 1112]
MNWKILRCAFVFAALTSANGAEMTSEFAKNEEVRLDLRKQGDDGRTPRLLQHYAYFPSADAEKAYADFLISKAYQIERESGDSPGDNPWGVIFTKVQAPIDIDDETANLGLKANSLGGEYDGWETDLIRK